ncbi:MAG: PTS sugar transporter subunit IIA [Candidatus Gygaella obscura]|nr:PTS sugar transporter subunit IIA [Candidatus Gygaella obscura]
MNIVEYIKKDCLVMDLKSTAKEEAVNEIVSCFDSESIKNKKLFIKEILQREEEGSTGIGFGVAIPHARADQVKDFVIGFGRSREGIEFNSIDKNKVHIVFVLGANPNYMSLYLRMLAELAKYLMYEDVREKLLAAENVDDVLGVFNKS